MLVVHRIHCSADYVYSEQRCRACGLANLDRLRSGLGKRAQTKRDSKCEKKLNFQCVPFDADACRVAMGVRKRVEIYRDSRSAGADFMLLGLLLILVHFGNRACVTGCGKRLLKAQRGLRRANPA
jgi:hypothetical protein